MDDGDDLDAARSLLAAGNKAEAFNHLIKAKAAAAGDPVRLDAVASGMEEAGQHGSALELRQVIIGAAPDDLAANLAYLQTRIAVANGDDAALKVIENELSALLARQPHGPAALWLKAADIYHWVRAPGRQLWAIRRALATSAGSVEIKRQVANRYCYSGRPWRAWWVLQGLTRRADVPVEHLGGLSHVSQDAGCPNLGIRFARRLQAVEPGNLGAVVLEAKAYRAKGKTRHAAALVKARLAEFLASQDSAHWALQAAAVLSAGGELDAERALLTHAATAWPENGEIAMALQIARFGMRA